MANRYVKMFKGLNVTEKIVFSYIFYILVIHSLTLKLNNLFFIILHQKQLFSITAENNGNDRFPISNLE